MKIFITGGTGRQGGAVARRLLQKDHHIVVLTRYPDSAKARALRAAGAEIQPGGFTDTALIEKCARRADGFFLMSTPFETGAEAETSGGKSVIDAAVRAGVGHIVFSSVASADRKTGVPHFESKYLIEEYLKTKPIPWTIVAPASFYENVLAAFEAPEREGGVYASALPPDTPNQMIGVDTIGDFVAHVFERADAFYRRRIDIAAEELTGARLAAILGRALGKSVAYRELPAGAVRARSRDLAVMYDWMRDRGYDVDIADLKSRYPEVHWESFDDWASRQRWPESA